MRMLMITPGERDALQLLVDGGSRTRFGGGARSLGARAGLATLDAVRSNGGPNDARGRYGVQETGSVPRRDDVRVATSSSLAFRGQHPAEFLLTRPFF